MAKIPPTHNGKPRQNLTSAEWFYERRGEGQEGPVGFPALRELAMDGKLLAHDLVWKKGATEKKEAGRVVGLIPAPKRPPEPVPPSDLSDADPYASPKTRTIADGPPGGLYLPHLRQANLPVFLFSILAAGGLVFLSTKLPTEKGAVIVLLLAGFSLAFWIALAISYIYRAWTMMGMLGAHLSGSKAIRFLFIPVFNALWCFVVVYGWARLWNYNVRNHPGLQPAHPVWKPLFFLFPIMFLVSQALLAMHFLTREWPLDPANQNHLISMGVWGATLVLTAICWCQIGRSINFLARKKM